MVRLKSILQKFQSSAQRGREAESIAIEFLQQRGLRLVKRNYRCRHGEIDLIMRQSDTLIFVEVRYRQSATFGSALESIDERKKSRIVRSALHYLTAKKICQASRIDVVAISPGHNQLDIDWITDAFQC